MDGDPVTILNDPHNPERASIQSVRNAFMLWFAPLITFFLGLVFIGALVVTYKLMK